MLSCLFSVGEIAFIPGRGLTAYFSLAGRCPLACQCWSIAGGCCWPGYLGKDFYVCCRARSCICVMCNRFVILGPKAQAHDKKDDKYHFDRCCLNASTYTCMLKTDISTPHRKRESLLNKPLQWDLSPVSFCGAALSPIYWTLAMNCPPFVFFDMSLLCVFNPNMSSVRDRELRCISHMEINR